MENKTLFQRIFNTKSTTRQILGNLRTSPYWWSVKLFGDYSTIRNIQNFVNEGYGKNPHVYTVVNKIAQTTSRLPFEIEDSNGNTVERGELYELMKKPNPDQFGNEFIEEILIQLLVTGNAYIHGINASGFATPGELRVLPSKQTQIICNKLHEVIKYKVWEYSKWNYYEAEEVLHIKFSNIVDEDEKRKYGFSPLESAVMVYTASNNILEAEASIFKNKGIAGILTNDTDTPILEDERERLQGDFQNVAGGADKAGKVLVSNSKLRYLQLGMSPEDLKLLEASISKLRTICSIYGVDSSLFNDPANKTYNNRAEAQRSFYSDVVVPLAEMVVKYFNEWLFKDSNEMLVVDTSKIDVLKAINKEFSDKVLQEYNAGLISIEEARMLLDHE